MVSSREARRLVELACARLCHDLSGLAGMLAGVMDQAVEEAPGAADSLSVGRDAACELVQRLKLLRSAWGPDSQALTVHAILTLVAGLTLSTGRPNARRVAIHAAGVPAKAHLTPGASRLALNLLLLAAEALPRGGTISLAGSATDLCVTISGPRAAWPGGLAECLADEAAAFAAATDARSLQMPLTALMAHGPGVRLVFGAPPDDGEPPALHLLTV